MTVKHTTRMRDESVANLTDPLTGLSKGQIEEQQRRGLYNSAPPDTGRTYSRIFFDNLFTVVHMILLTIAGTLIALGFFGDAIVTAGLVVANVSVGMFQEARAKRKLDRIALLLRPEARVVRDGSATVIDPEEIVQGDVLIAESGDQFLVDGVVVHGGPANADESLLTGESDLVPKRYGDPVYSGSFCMTGGVRYMATRVGQESVVNELTAGARSYRTIKTPLQREVALIIQIMLVMAIVLALQVANQYRGGELDLPFSESVRAAAVIFGLVPQGLVFMVTVTYAMAAVRLAGQGLLIQRMNSVESTSHVDILCLDKTGTLTTNRLFLDQIVSHGVTEADLRERLGTFVASISHRNRTAEALAEGLPATPSELRAEVPFSSDWKWSGGTCITPAGDDTILFGAPESIGQFAAIPDQLLTASDQLTYQGLRVLLVAESRNGLSEPLDFDQPSLPDDLHVIGLVAIRDELRPDAQETIEHFRRAGVQPKVISGDHPETVATLARQAGLDGSGRAISGYEIDQLSDQELERVAVEASVFGRITPRQKERLVDALTRQGHYVAMIGDGVNDVLALKKAHVAMAMRSGSQVTRSVADLVLMDDSFSSLPRAFQEGQRILRGMEAIIRLFLTRGFYMGLIVIGVSLLGYPFPSTPRLDTLLTLLTIGVPIIALAYWATPGDSPKQIVRSASHFFIPAALLTALLGIVIYVISLEITGDHLIARTVLVTTSVLNGIVLVAFANPPSRWFAVVERSVGNWQPTAISAAMILGYLFILTVPQFRRFYELEILNPSVYAAIVLVVAVWMLVLRGLWMLDPVERITGRMRRSRSA